MTLAEVAAACATDGCGLPLPPDGLAAGNFAEPWQAHAFAMVLLLHERGVFSWQQWADTLARRIRAAQTKGDPDDGSNYYHHWLDALEEITIAQGIATADQLHALEHAWERAAQRTAHGQPIVLSSADDGSSSPEPHTG